MNGTPTPDTPSASPLLTQARIERRLAFVRSCIVAVTTIGIPMHEAYKRGCTYEEEDARNAGFPYRPLFRTYNAFKKFKSYHRHQLAHPHAVSSEIEEMFGERNATEGRASAFFSGYTVPCGDEYDPAEDGPSSHKAMASGVTIAFSENLLRQSDYRTDKTTLDDFVATAMQAIARNPSGTFVRRLVEDYGRLTGYAAS